MDRRTDCWLHGGWWYYQAMGKNSWIIWQYGWTKTARPFVMIWLLSKHWRCRYIIFTSLMLWNNAKITVTFLNCANAGGEMPALFSKKRYSQNQVITYYLFWNKVNICLTCIPIFETSDMMRWQMINVSRIYHLQNPSIEYFINTVEYFIKRTVGENHYEIFV